MNKKSSIRFLIIGAINSVIDITLTYLFVNFFALDNFWANFVSTTICGTISFVVNRKWTFEQGDKNLVYHIVSFIIVTLIGVWFLQGFIVSLLTPIISSLFTSLNWPILFLIPDEALIFSKMLAILVGMCWNYFLYASLVFGKTGDKIANFFIKSKS